VRAALAWVLVVLAVPASAGAAPVVTLRSHPGPELREGPFITGAGVGWTQARCIENCADPELGESDELYLIRASGAGGRIRTLFRTRVRHNASGPNPVQESYSAWLSPNGLAVLRGGSDGGLALRAGRPGGVLERLFECSFDGADDVPVALDGRTLVYEPDPCSPPVRLAVRDVPSGETRVISLEEPDNPGSLRVRGRFAAWQRYQPGGLHVVVFDLASGTPAYVAAIEPPVDWTLGEDGTVAATTGSSRSLCDGRVSWYSVAEPVRHELPIPACIDRVRIENRRIFFVGPRAGARFLRSVSLAGDTEQHVRFGRVLHRSFDVRGARVAWAARDCGGGDAVFRGRLAGDVLNVGPVGCPTRFAPGPGAVRRGRVEVRLECPRGCSGALALVRHGRLLSEDEFGRPRGRRTVTLGLSPATRRLLERRGSLRVRAALTARDRAFRPVRSVRSLLLVLRRR
jgi:hypothetical protein